MLISRSPNARWSSGSAVIFKSLTLATFPTETPATAAIRIERSPLKLPSILTNLSPDHRTAGLLAPSLSTKAQGRALRGFDKSHSVRSIGGASVVGNEELRPRSDRIRYMVVWFDPASGPVTSGHNSRGISSLE